MVDTRAPGDYPAKLYAGPVPATRGVLYRADENVRAVIRHVGLINEGTNFVRARVWVSGVLVAPMVELAGLSSAPQDVSMWVLEPGEAVEAEATVPGVNAVVYGVEEVS